jgi:hypothetical protein
VDLRISTYPTRLNCLFHYPNYRLLKLRLFNSEVSRFAVSLLKPIVLSIFSWRTEIKMVNFWQFCRQQKFILKKIGFYVFFWKYFIYYIQLLLSYQFLIIISSFTSTIDHLSRKSHLKPEVNIWINLVR